MKRLYAVKAAAVELGLQYRQLNSAINEGLVPIYRLRKSRRMVCINEIMQIMKQQGAGNV